MKIIKKIIVKQILTEKSKQDLYIKFEHQIEQLNKEIAQLMFEKKKFEKTKKTQTQTFLSQIEKEIASRNEKSKILQFQLNQLEILPIGSELKETEVQGIIEISEGDHWDELVKNRTIIIKDGFINEIR